VNPEIARTSHPSISSRADPPQQQRVKAITLPKYKSDSTDFIREDAQQQVNQEIARTSHPSTSSRADPPQQQRVKTTPSPSESSAHNRAGTQQQVKPRAKKIKLVIDLTNDDELNLSREREEYQAMTIETLRPICIKKGITMGRGVDKEHLVQKLMEHDASRQAISRVGGTHQVVARIAKPLVKTKHCAFRLLNVLFSGYFEIEFATLGNAATRRSLTMAI
jgi:hypothetical protein